ncbi:methyltransferase domain-containing protein [Pedobacter sp. LMG 31464]|uniref:Methyltransferase domain-containing protein n=1 Tax=Pedobacter planticolens TaxID=2679964 RepID=A0A923DVF3_9SPHI|nr:class I SAM-dependent methyltransferase [Pedobacter planticolens]MBB2144647.1 methyltransferase domain-containing protein [Pedobacter planticolens]
MEVLDNISHVRSLNDRLNSFEFSYLSLREKEQRIYTDKELAILPNVPKSHVYYKEWQIRRQSAERFINYLKKKNRPLKVLEIGCGNAWLSSKIAELNFTNVVGIDTNREEIKQASRIFKKDNLELKALNFSTEAMSDMRFDIILFAASIQYFPSIQEIIAKSKQYLLKKGEIHLIDTNFYDSITAIEAKKRTQLYFTKMGFPEMDKFYFHHQLDELTNFNYQVIYNPKLLLNRLFIKNPFYWICIK